ncbi:putative nonribosomal peptide synthetase [Mycena sanguinolenta]|nr:putative nonribosomal peptide synthetase [Mycena sanguinolenta]
MDSKCHLELDAAYKASNAIETGVVTPQDIANVDLPNSFQNPKSRVLPPQYHSLTRHCSSASDLQDYMVRISLAVTLKIHSASNTSLFCEVESETLSEAHICRLITLAFDSNTPLRDLIQLSEQQSKGQSSRLGFDREAVHAFLAIHSLPSWPKADNIPGWQLETISLLYRVPLAIEIIPSPFSGTEIRFSCSTTARPVEDINVFANHFVAVLHYLQGCQQNHQLTVNDILVSLGDYDAAQTLEFGKRRQLPTESLPKSLVHELFETCAQKTPSAVALEFEASSTLSYGELDQFASDLAVDLRNQHGVHADVMVPILFDTSFEMIIAILAVMKAGGAYVPLALDLPKATLRERLEIIGGNVLICGPGLEPRAADLIAVCPGMKLLGYVMPDTGSDGVVRKLTHYPASPSQLAYVFFTSGTTGKPNGVGVEHRNLAAFLVSSLGVEMAGKDKKKLLLSPYVFDISVADIFTTLTSGGVLALVGRAKLLSNLPYWVDATNTTHLSVTPSIGRLLPTTGLISLTHIIFGGEALPPDLAERMSRTRTVINSMGPTEATIYDTLYFFPKSSGELPDRTPIGYPLDTSRLYVLRPCTMELAAHGETGEICIGGPQVSRGYVTNPALSKVKFVPDIFEGTGKIFRTGDWGRWNRFGELEILGRMDGQLKFHGIRVEAEEIERVVRGASSDIDDFYSTVLEIEGYQKLVGAFTLRDGGKSVSVLETIQAKQIIDLVIKSCSAQLPPTIQPSIFLCFGSLPKTLNNKLDRRTLNADIRDYIATSTTRKINPNNVAARTAAENTVTSVVAAVLAMIPESVGLAASFLELGGTSMQAMRVTTSLQAMGINVSVVDVLSEDMTIARLAQLPRFNPDSGSHTTTLNPAWKSYLPFSLAPAQWEEELVRAGLVVSDVEDIYPCTSLAKYWLELAFQNDGRALICQFHHILGNDIDPERFCWAWDQLRIHEPTLRTVFLRVPGKDSASEPVLSCVVLGAKVEGRSVGLEVLSVSDDKELQNLVFGKCFAEHRVEMGLVPIRAWLILNTTTKTWSFAISRHHALHDARTFDLQNDAFSVLYAHGPAGTTRTVEGRAHENSYGAFIASLLKDRLAQEAEAFWEQYLQGAHCPIWPATAPVPVSFCKDMGTYALHFAEWKGNLADLAKRIGVTSGALIRGAYAIATAEGEGESDSLVFEVADGSGVAGFSSPPWGFCAHVKPTRIHVPLDGPGCAQVSDIQVVPIVREANRSHVATLPYIGSAWDMSQKMLAAEDVNFATSILNILDLSRGDFRKDMKNEDQAAEASEIDSAPGVRQIFSGTLAAETVVGIYVPVYVEVRIQKEKVTYICPYDPIVANTGSVERFVNRQIEVLSRL